MYNEYLEKTEYVDYDIEYKIATSDDMEQLMSSRLEMLKVVNDLDFDYEYSDEIIESSIEYFKKRHGIAMKMVSMLIDEAWERGVTGISLDATEEGRPLSKKLGFVDSTEGMVLVK